MKSATSNRNRESAFNLRGTYYGIPGQAKTIYGRSYISGRSDFTSSHPIVPSIGPQSWRNWQRRQLCRSELVSLHGELGIERFPAVISGEIRSFRGCESNRRERTTETSCTFSECPYLRGFAVITEGRWHSSCYLAGHLSTIFLPSASDLVLMTFVSGLGPHLHSAM